MKEFIWKALSGNQLASGGIVLMGAAVQEALMVQKEAVDLKYVA
jgi:hypothetical protein